MNKRSLPENYDQLPAPIKSLIVTAEPCEAVTYSTLSNCHISPYGAVFRKGWLVMDSLYKMYPSRRTVLTFYKKILLGRVRRISTPCLVAFNPFYANYGHFLFESLPRIFATRALHADLTLVLPEIAPRYVREFAALFAFRDIVQVKEHELIFTPEVVLPNSYHFAMHHYDMMRDLKTFLLGKTKAETAGSRKVLLSRDKAAYRKSIREDELFHRIKPLGFEKVFAEDLSVHDQIRLFGNTGYLAGIHSTGLNNCLFMPDGASVVNILLEGHHDISVYNVSQISRQHFSFVIAPRLHTKKLVSFDDPDLDVQKITSYIEASLM